MDTPGLYAIGAAASLDCVRPLPRRRSVIASAGITLVAMRTLLRRFPVPLLVLVGAGVVLRGWAWFAFAPAVMNSADSWGYVVYAHTSVFNDVVHPAGYALVLKTIGWISSSARVPILLQHLLGIGTALVAYSALRRAAAPQWAALIPAAAVLLSIDQITLEHQFMPETIFTLLVVGSCYGAIRALGASRDAEGTARPVLLWLATAGCLLGLAAYVRNVALGLGPFLALWALLALPRPWLRWRIPGAATALGAVLVMALLYSGAHQIKAGYFGFTPYGGWATYVRTAQFADCTAFTPPAGTAQLCERTPGSARPGPDFYAWEPGSPARKLFGGPPNGASKLGEFGRAAILHQPFDYLDAVFTDFVRFFAPSYQSERPFAGPAFDVLDFDRRAPVQEAALTQQINRWYDDEHVSVSPAWAQAFQDLQQILRVSGVVLLQLMVLAVAGLLAGQPRFRAAISLLLGGGVLLLLVPAATAVYNARYSVPAAVVFAAAGALAATSLWERAMASRSAVSEPATQTA
jgi:hypothetical protein